MRVSPPQTARWTIPKLIKLLEPILFFKNKFFWCKKGACKYWPLFNQPWERPPFKIRFNLLNEVGNKLLISKEMLGIGIALLLIANEPEDNDLDSLLKLSFNLPIVKVK